MIRQIFASWLRRSLRARTVTCGFARLVGLVTLPTALCTADASLQRVRIEPSAALCLVQATRAMGMLRRASTAPHPTRLSGLVVAVLAVHAACNVQAYVNGVANTPPMGWSGYNALMQGSGHCDKAGAAGYNQTTFVQTMDYLVSSGLRDLGYVYLNADDCWMAETRGPVRVAAATACTSSKRVACT